MSDVPTFTTDTQPTLQQLVDYFVDSLYDEKKMLQFQRAMTNAGAEAATVGSGAAVAAADWFLEKLAKFLFAVEEHVETVAGPPLSRLAGHLIGRDVPITEMRRAASADGESVVGGAIAKMALDALRAPDGELSPGGERAQRFLSMLGQLVVNGWFESTAFELIVTALPDMDGFESVAELPHQLIDALGLGRLSRIALRPLAQIGIATPLEWELHKRHRPTLLGASTVARQLARGRGDSGAWLEDLARQGYSDTRIEALLNEAQKYFSVAELDLLRRAGTFEQDAAVLNLRDAGWRSVDAELLLRLEELKRDEAFERSMADAAVTAYEKRLIDDATLTELTGGSMFTERSRSQFRELAQVKRALNIKHLSPTEAYECALLGIVPVSDYRQALEREGYDGDAVYALELRLRHAIDTKRAVAEHRADQDAARAAAAQAKADAAAAKKAEIAAAVAVKQLGPIAELERAVVRGIVPIARLEQVLHAHFDAETVQIYVADVEQQRQAYLAQQQHAADAAKRAAASGLSTGELQTALVDGVLTADQVRTLLTDRGRAPADVDVLVATMQQKADAHAAAATAHDAAVRKGLAQQIDVVKAEQLVRAGHWTLAQFDQQLAALGETDAAIAAIDLLLQDQIAKDDAARRLKAETAARDAAKGLSLAQARQAVILGVSTLAQFQTYLVAEHYGADAITTLVAETKDAAAAAATARARRAAAARAEDGRAVPLAEVTRAARLGLITPAAYQAELEARGYGADDVALELDLLLHELAATKQAQATQAAKAAATAPKGLTLSELATAVKAGAASIDAYRARAVALGFPAADVQILTTVLQDALDTLAGAARRHVTIDGELAARSLSLSDVEAAVKAGTQTLDAYQTWLEANGYGPADAALLRALLEAKVAHVAG